MAIGRSKPKEGQRLCERSSCRRILEGTESLVYYGGNSWKCITCAACGFMNFIDPTPMQKPSASALGLEATCSVCGRKGLATPEACEAAMREEIRQLPPTPRRTE